MTIRNLACPLLAYAAAGVLACNNSAAPGTLRNVEFRLAASNAGVAAATGPVTITSLQLVVGPAALGSGDQFGCIDCQGDNETDGAPQLIRVPTDGSPVSVTTEQVQPGRYSAAEIELQHPNASVVAADPSWPSEATVGIGGTMNGTPFTLYLALEGSFRETLNPPVDVTEAVTPGSISVTVTLPVGSWFTANGTALDPNDAAERAQIEQNAKSALSPPEGGAGERE
jgi:hypothetical protein